MAIFFEPSVKGFFDSDIHEAIPEGAVEITRDHYRSLMDSQTQGLVIAVDEDGFPQALPKSFTTDEVFANARLRRDSLLRASDVTQLPDYPITDAERELWRLYRQALRDLPQRLSDPTSIEWPTPPNS